MRHIAPAVLAALLTAGVVAGCAANQVTSGGTAEFRTDSVPLPTRGAPVASAGEFLRLAARGSVVDYQPLESPAAALASADLVVSGRLAAVVPGETPDPGGSEEDCPEGPCPAAVLLVIEVGEVFKGDLTSLGGNKVFVQVSLSPTVDVGRLISLAPIGAQVSAVTANHQREDPALIRPEGLPATAVIMHAWTDGLWLQGRADDRMGSIFVQPSQLAPAWDSPTSVEAFSQRLRDAALAFG